MAGDWIPMRLDLIEDPAVIQIATVLGMDEYGVVGRLHRVWSWINTQSRNGHAPGVTTSWLDRYVSATGFADAMVKAGWLIVDATGLTFPKFDNWNSQGAKARLLATRRKQKQRIEMSRTCHAPTVTEARPEERREEINSPTESSGVPPTHPPESKPTPKAVPREPAKGVHHEFIRAFGNRWQTKYGEPYPFKGGKDAAAVKSLREFFKDELERFAAAVDRYLADTEPFVANAHHTLTLMLANVAKYIVAGPVPKIHRAEDEMPMRDDFPEFSLRGQKGAS